RSQDDSHGHEGGAFAGSAALCVQRLARRNSRKPADVFRPRPVLRLARPVRDGGTGGGTRAPGAARQGAAAQASLTGPAARLALCGQASQIRAVITGEPCPCTSSPFPPPRLRSPWAPRPRLSPTALRTRTRR